jgi:hypothetical protein
MRDTDDHAHRNLADDARFQPLNELHERYYYTNPQTGQSQWLSLAEALAKKAELDKAAMQREDAEANENA